MRHPTDGTLRRLVDEPAGVADADREHVVGCPVCLSGVAAARQDAAVAGAALNVQVDVDVDAGWRRLSRAAAAAKGRGVAAAAPAHRWRAALRSPVLAALGAVVLLTGAGVAAATDWLQIFRTEQIAPVTAPEKDLVRLPDLSDIGDVETTEKVGIRPVADADAAREATGLAAPRVGELPAGITGEPAYFVGGRASAVFTFSAEKAARTVEAAGETLPPPPPGLDGSRFRLVAGPGLAAVWPGARDVPALIVARVAAPTVYSSGIPFATARDYLLSLPGLPENVVSQLRSLSADGPTLPLFMTTEQMESSTADVGGVPATVFTSRDGTMAGVVWVHDGTVTAVAGSVKSGEALSVARGLRWDR
jgi:hypothetical protein